MCPGPDSRRELDQLIERAYISLSSCSDPVQWRRLCSESDSVGEVVDDYNMLPVVWVVERPSFSLPLLFLSPCLATGMTRTTVLTHNRLREFEFGNLQSTWH
jgi:hypothetical protein